MSSRLVCCGNSSTSTSTTTNTSSPVLTNTTTPVAIEEKCSVCMALPSSFSRRKKVCALCLQAVCTSCIPIDPRSRNHKVCSICQIIICNLSTRSDLDRLKTQHLVRFIDANRIDRRGCRDKSEIVELILRSRTHIIRSRAAAHSHHHSNSLPLSSLSSDSASHQSSVSNNNSFNHTMGEYASRSDYRRQSSQHQQNRSSTNSTHSNRSSAGQSSSNPSNSSYRNLFNGFEQSMSSLANGMSSLANQMAASARTFCNPATGYPNVGRSNAGPMFQTTTTVLQPGGPGNCARTMTTMTTRMTIHPDQQQQSARSNTTRTSTTSSNHRRHHRSQQQEYTTPQPPPAPPSPPIPTVLLVEIKSEDDIERMTVRQMKELLNFHLVSAYGCIEKSDLQNKVKELWEDEKEKRRLRDKGERDGGDTDRSYTCKICMDDVVDCVFVECGHMVTCLECGKKIRNCPICRQNIVKVIKTFRS